MALFGIFTKMRNNIKERVVNHKPGLYLYLVFPIAFTFLTTFIIVRLIGYYYPSWTIPWSNDFRVHHFVYGIFVLATSGYLALVFDGPRAKYLISLLHGFALGLTFDEFWFWLKLSDDDISRWSYDGLLVFVGAVFLIISAPHGVKALRLLWPFKRKEQSVKNKEEILQDDDLLETVPPPTTSLE